MCLYPNLVSVSIPIYFLSNFEDATEKTAHTSLPIVTCIVITMRSISLLLLCLLWSLVEVQSVTKYPYISFRGTILPNHSYVDLSLVGNDRKGSDTNTIQCHTDLTTCCRVQQGVHRGDWFAPGNDTRLTFFSEGGDIFEDRQAQVVHLRRRNNAAGPSGIYRCVVATNAVRNDSDGYIGETVYVGLYTCRGGT